MSRLVCVPNEVRNGATSGIVIRRSSTPVSFIGPSCTTYQPAAVEAGRSRHRRPPGTTSASRTATRHRGASAGSLDRSAPMSRGHGDQRGRSVGVARHGRAVTVDAERDGGARSELVGDSPWRAPPGAGRDHRGIPQPPAHQQPVGVIDAVDGVEHRAVEVRQVLDRLGAQLGQVEVRVAADQRVEGPGDLRDAAQQCPGPLVQLEREPDVAAGHRRRDPGDVAVQRVLGRRVEEADARADQTVAVERAADVVARLGERPQQLEGHRRVGVAAPDRGEQATTSSSSARSVSSRTETPAASAAASAAWTASVEIDIDSGQARSGRPCCSGSPDSSWSCRTRRLEQARRQVGQQVRDQGARAARYGRAAHRRARARRRRARRRRPRRGRRGSACRPRR